MATEGGQAESNASKESWRAALLLGGACVAVGALYSFLIMPAVLDCPCWWMNTEVFAPLDAARFIGNGAYPYLYEGSRLWIAGPGIPILLVPVVWVGDSLGLTQAPAPYPGMWLMLGPLTWFAVVPVLAGARALGERIASGARRAIAPLTLQIVILVTAVPAVAIVFGHIEDIAAVAAILFAILAGTRDRWDRSALWLAAAIIFKQWAILAAATMWVAVPRGRNVSWLLPVLALPAIAYLIPLAVDPEHARSALLGGRAFTGVGHPALWVDAAQATVVATIPRLAVVVMSLVIPWALRAKASRSAGALAVLGIIFTVRLALEPVVFAYYLFPALAFGLTALVADRRRFLAFAGAGLALTIWFLAHPPEWLWWSVAFALLGWMGWCLVRSLAGSEEGTDLGAA